MRRFLPAILCGSGILLGIALLSALALSVRGISHDDGISYLAATGHQGQYETGKPDQKWASGREWQALWTPDRFWCFRRIARDLAEQDIHPPLYFWLLHAWSFLYGITPATGPLLNIPFHIIACLAIVGACRLLGCSRWIAVAVGLLWLLGGKSLHVVVETRQYSMLAALAALFIWSLLSFMLEPSMKAAACLCIAIAAGSLTHYHFPILVAACGGIAALQLLAKKRWRELGLLAGSALLAGAFFFMLHPAFYRSFVRQAAQAQPFAPGEIPTRLYRVAGTFLGMFFPPRLAWTIVKPAPWLWAVLCVVVLVATVVLVGRTRPHFRVKWLAGPAAIPLAAGMISFVMVALLYVSCRSPRHAMSVKYAMFLSPPIFIAAGQFVDWLHKRRRLLAIAVIAACLVSQATWGIATARHAWLRAREPRENPLRPDLPLVLDFTERGFLIPVLWHADPRTQVFAAGQECLLSKGLPELPAPGILFVSGSGSSCEAGRLALLQAFAARGFQKQTLIRTSLWSCDTYELRRNEAAANRADGR